MLDYEWTTELLFRDDGHSLFGFEDMRKKKVREYGLTWNLLGNSASAFVRSLAPFFSGFFFFLQVGPGFA